MTTRVKRSAKSAGIEVLVGMDQELLKGLVQETVQEVWEAQVTEALGGTVQASGPRSGAGITAPVRATSATPRARCTAH